MLVFLALACSGSGDIDVVGDTDGGAPVEVGIASVRISAPPAFDPILGGPVGIDVVATSTTAAIVTARLLDGDGAVIWEATEPFTGERTLSYDWDGRLGDGSRAQVGSYTIDALVQYDPMIASAAAIVDQHELAIVRAGFVEAYAEGDGIISDRVPLYFHQSASLQDAAEAFSTLPGIDTDDGAAAHFDAVGADLNRRGEIEPIAYTYDSRPILTLVPGASDLLGGNGLNGADVSVSIDGWTAVAGVPLRVGTPVVLMKDAPLADAPGVIETSLGLEFHTTDEDGGDWVIGVQQLPVRIYALLDQSGFENQAAKYHPWPAVVDPALRGIEGVEADHDAVINALVQWIYWENGLEYDTRYGASAYVNYAGDWDDAHFYLTDFLSRRFGTVINCTDCAAILGAYANMLGAKLGYTIILANFDLNYIQAIGGEEFDRCPFGDTGCGFSYHAVTTSDGGGTIWDATLALDGDDDPSELPGTFLQVEAIDGDEYLMRLSPDSPRYQYESQGTLQ